MKKKSTIKLLMALMIPLIFNFSPLFAQSKNFLSAKGNQLYDASGKEVRLTGVNWFGFETSLVSPHGIWARDMKSMLKQIKDLGFNCVRVPWCNDMLAPTAKVNISSFGTDSYTGVTPMNKEESLAKTPIELLDIFIRYCQENNLKVILDNHSRAADGYMNETLWYIPAYPETKWISDWVFIANRYKDYDAVIGMDLDNEPHGGSGPNAATWGNNNPATNWNKAAEKCGNAILAVNPDVLILVEGTELYNGKTYWWGGNLKGARDYPIVLSKPNKLVYSPHEYGPEVFNQAWFNTPTFPSNMAGIWDEHFGYLYNDNVAPLLVGEFGIRENTGKSAIWFDTFMKYMGSKYSWTFWCWNPNSGDTGGLLEGNWSTLVTWKYNILKPYLAPMIPNGSLGNVNTPPVASFTATPKTGIAPVTVVFDGSASTDADGDVLTYVWSFGDGTSGAGKTASHTYATAGNFESKLTVSDGKGGSNSTTILIAVTSPGGNNAPLAKIAAAPTTGIAPLAVAFDASGSSDPDAGDVLTYAWTFGDGSAGTGRTISHTYATAATYEAKLTVTDSKGAVSTATVTITANSVSTSKLKVQYKVQNVNATDNQVNPLFQIVNSGTEAVPYSELTIRYWFTREGSVDQTFFCDYAIIGSSKVLGKFAPVASPSATANYYLEVGFANTAGSLVAGSNSGDIQTRFAKNDWSPYNEANDYSYDPTKIAYTDWNKVTLYRKGQLVWGTEPTSAAARTVQEDIKVTVSPNPVQEGAALSISFAEQDDYTVTITDMANHVVFTQKVSAKNETIQFPAIGKNGAYILKVVNSKKQIVVKRLLQY